MSCVVKCLYQKAYCTIYGEIQHECPAGHSIDLDCSNYLPKKYDKETVSDCNFKEWLGVTMYRKVASVEITPEKITLGRLILAPADVFELWVDYGDGNGFIPEIVHD